MVVMLLARRVRGGRLLAAAAPCGAAGLATRASVRPAAAAGLAPAATSAAAPASGSGLPEPPPPPLHVCVVGTGPAGLYTADRLLGRYGDGVRVDLLERLPTPFGLVRSGVAPDHPGTKLVANRLARVAADPRVRLVANAALGPDVSLPELRALYHAVVLAYGSEGDRPLGVPGEGRAGVLAAREFVWWYNGHPDHVEAYPIPEWLAAAEHAAVVGQGNVAVDCARVLLRDPAALAATDAAAHALAALAAAPVRSVAIVGRRGPTQAAFTPKELRELLGLPGVTVRIAAEDLMLTPEDAAELAASRPHRRVYEVLAAAAEAAAASGAERAAAAAAGVGPPQRDLFLRFYRSPVALLAGPPGATSDGPGRVGTLRLERTRLEPAGGPAGGAGAAPPVRRAVGTGEVEDLPAELVLKSIGYRGLPVAGLPFDARAGTVPSEAGGRVLFPAGDGGGGGGGGLGAGAEAAAADPAGPPLGPLYVVGWLKRGPSGIIGTNLICAEETADALEADRSAGCLAPDPARPAAATAGLRALLAGRGVVPVDWAGWERIDAEELARGAARGRPREKLVDRAELLRVAAGPDSPPAGRGPGGSAPPA